MQEAPNIQPWRPTKARLQAAYGKTIPTVIAPGLDVLFVGINPSLYSAAVGHHFARPGNRFWPTLHLAGFTERLLSPFEGALLLERGCGITCIVRKATATAAEIPREWYVQGGKELMRKLRRYRPRVAAVLGVGAYQAAFNVKKVRIGKQEERLGPSELWVLPNPSGLNANYQLPALAELFGELRESVESRKGARR